MSKENEPPRLFAHELKRRRVPRVALVYMAAAFATVEAADVVFPRLQLPDWTVTLVVGLALVGFPIAVGLAWAFDLTSGGVQRTAPSAAGGGSGGEAAEGWEGAYWFGGKTLAATVILGAVGLGLAAGWFIRPADPDAEATARAFDKIAVLPLRNANVDDRDNAVLALGIHDDLLTRLARIGSFRVISRTSVMEYADTDRTIPEIAQELGADAVLEGGVQRAGATVRINMQLIDGRTDEHLWAETFDMPFSMESIFAVQSEIVERVAEAMQRVLTPEEATAIAEVPTTDTTAFRLWNEAVSLADDLLSEPSLRGAIGRVNTALDADPAFAEAWALLSVSHSRMWFFFFDRSPETLESARLAAERAVELAPELAASHAAMGEYYYHGLLDYQPAVESYRRALELDSSHSESYEGLAAVRRRQGRMSEALELFQQSLELDPRRAVAWHEVALTLSWMRRLEDVRRMVSKGVALAPNARGQDLCALHPLGRWSLLGRSPPPLGRPSPNGRR